MVSQQSECGVDEIVEVEQSGRALLSLEPLDGGAQFLDEAPSATAPIAPAERVPRVAAPDVAARRFVVHQARLRLGMPTVFAAPPISPSSGTCRSRPWS